MSRGRFRYPLEPVLLTRRWAVDALRLTLGEHNAAIATQAALQVATQASLDAAATAWRTAAAAQQAYSVQTFVLNVRFRADLGRQLHEQAAQMTALGAARDAVVAELVQAQRALEAVEQHRDEMVQHAIAAQARAGFKVADDQWNTRGAGHGHQA